VKGEAVASVIIALVNLVGGLVIGILQHGMPVPKAIDVYSRLTIGDGLVSAVPALFVSVATGLLISRSSQAVDLSRELGRQFTSRPHVLAITGVFLAVLSLTGLPFVPLAAMAAVSFCGAWLLRGRRPGAALAEPVAGAETPSGLADVLTDERIVFELGAELLALVRGPAPLVAQSQAVRSAIAADLGIVVPAITFRDDLSLPPRGFRITIADVPVRTAELADDVRLDEAGMLTAALVAAVRERADALLTRDACARLVETLRAAQPAVVGQIIPEVLSLAKVHRTLQALLREALPIRPLAEVLELMADHAAEAPDPAQLADIVRGRLVRTLCRRARDPDGRLVVVRLTDAAIAALRATPAEEAGRDMPSERGTPAARAVAEVRRAVRPRLERGAAAVVVVPGAARREIRDRLAQTIPGLIVVGANEVAGEDRVEVFATIGGTEATRAA